MNSIQFDITRNPSRVRAGQARAEAVLAAWLVSDCTSMPEFGGDFYKFACNKQNRVYNSDHEDTIFGYWAEIVDIITYRL